MTKEIVMVLPPILFKAADSDWGNADNLWLRQHGLTNNLFLGYGKVESETAIFLASGNAWVITKGEKLFAGTLYSPNFSRGLNILSARSDIIGHADWSDREVLDFLIKQIVMMPTIDIATLARDVFVDGDKFARGSFGKVNNSGASGFNQLIPRVLRPQAQPEVYTIDLNKGHSMNETMAEKFRSVGEHCGVDPKDLAEFLSPMRKVDWTDLEDKEPEKFPPNPNPEELYSTSELCEFTGPSEKVFTPADLFIGIETGAGKTTSMQIMKSRVDSLRRPADTLDSLPASFFASRTREECEEILNGSIVDYPNFLGLGGARDAYNCSKLLARMREGIRTGFEKHLTDTEGPHVLPPGYAGQKVIGFDPGTGDFSVAMIKENKQPLSLTKEDVQLGNLKDFERPVMNTSGDVVFAALKRWNKLNNPLDSIRDSVKDGEARAESEQYLSDRKLKGE